MKKIIRNFGGTTLLGLMLITSNLALAQSDVETTSTTITSAGTVSDFRPGVIVIRNETSPNPVRYTYTKTTTYVDENGTPVSIKTVKTGEPVTVYYTQNGDKMVVSKVMVRKASVVKSHEIHAGTVTEEHTETTTTTTSTDHK